MKEYQIATTAEPMYREIERIIRTCDQDVIAEFNLFSAYVPSRQPATGRETSDEIDWINTFKFLDLTALLKRAREADLRPKREENARLTRIAARRAALDRVEADMRAKGLL